LTNRPASAYTSVPLLWTDAVFYVTLYVRKYKKNPHMCIAEIFQVLCRRYMMMYDALLLMLFVCRVPVFFLFTYVYLFLLSSYQCRLS